MGKIIMILLQSQQSNNKKIDKEHKKNIGLINMKNIPIQPLTSVNNYNAIIYTDLLIRFENDESVNLEYADVDNNLKDYLIIHHKDVFPTFIDIKIYDWAIESIREHLNGYLSNFFFKNYNRGVINLLQPKGPSTAIVYETECNRLRRYEFKVIHVPDMEVLFAFTYSQGKITLALGDLPLTKISSLLQEIGAWEV